MKKVHAADASPLASFFRHTSVNAKRAAYSTATSTAIDSQRQVIEQAKVIKEKQGLACM